jgi:hypothetical protein
VIVWAILWDLKWVVLSSVGFGYFIGILQARHHMSKEE